MNEAQHRVLKMLEAGTINAEEANRLLAVLGGRPIPPPEARPDPKPAPPVEPIPAVEAVPVLSEPSARPAPTFPDDVAALAAASSEEVLRQVARDETTGGEAPVPLTGSVDAASEPDETPAASDEATSSSAPDVSGPHRPKRRWRWWG